MSDIREMQDLSTKFNIHLDAVELVAQQGGQVRSYAPRTYGGGGETTPNTPATDPTYIDPNQPPAIQGPPSVSERPLLSDQGVAGGQQVNDLSNLPQEGRQKLAQGDFSGAQNLFQQYLTLQPEADDVGEVSFWLGEAYFVKGAYADAADAYIQSMRTDRDGVKAPDAMIRLAASLRELGNKDQACQTLDSFLSQYPNASEAVRNKRTVELGRTGC